LNWGKSMNSKLIGLAAGAAIVLGAASAAQATIINISATGGPTAVTFGPGDYRVEWIGVADGGAFNAWNPSCPTGDCVGGWRDVFRASTDPGPNPDLSVFSLPGPAFASALGSLAAFEAAPLVINSTLTWNGSVYTDTNDQLVPQPLFAHLDVQRTITFSAGDAIRADNFGGVSLRFTAVPEPATWAIMVLGFGGAGLMLRTRRRAVA
jgi:hypothetical protein